MDRDLDIMGGERNTKEKKGKMKERTNKPSRTAKEKAPTKIISLGPPSVINVIVDEEIEKPSRGRSVEKKTKKKKSKEKEKAKVKTKKRGEKKSDPSRSDSLFDSDRDFERFRRFEPSFNDDSYHNDDQVYRHPHPIPYRNEMGSLVTHQTTSTKSSSVDPINFSTDFLVASNSSITADGTRSKKSESSTASLSSSSSAVSYLNRKNTVMKNARTDWMKYLASAEGGPRLDDLQKELDFIQDVIHENKRQSSSLSAQRHLHHNNADNTTMTKPDESIELEQMRSDWKNYSRKGKTTALHQELDSIKSMLQEHKLRTLIPDQDVPEPRQYQSRTVSLNAGSSRRRHKETETDNLRKRPSALF